MAAFECRVTRIHAIEPIAGADAIEAAVIGAYRSVVKKGEFKINDLAVYIPEASLVPEWLLTHMGLTGRLAGPNKDRVKAIKLRGCLSQGLVYPLINQKRIEYFNKVSGQIERFTVSQGDDVKDLLGVKKWEPEIPANFAGELANYGQEITLHYDIENLKKYPGVFVDGEEVVMTEKLHGTFCGIVIVPEKDRNDEKLFMGRIGVFSKGLGAQGLGFKPSEANNSNVYIRALNALGVFETLFREYSNTEAPIFFLGEVFGAVQDLTYGQKLSFRLFDVAVGYRGDQEFIDYDGAVAIANILGFDRVPLLYRGPYSQAAVDEATNGKETVSGQGLHVREGVVIKPIRERFDYELGRVCLKSVSEGYLLRKNTNATEFQ